MVAHRNSPEMMPERKEFQGDRRYEELKGVTNERLEAWIRFMDSDLFKYLAKAFQGRRNQWLAFLIEPELLKSECEKKGVGIDYWQGAYMEDGVLEDTFEAIKNEFDIRTASNINVDGQQDPGHAAGERQRESFDLAGQSGFPGNSGPRSRFGYKNPR